MKPLSFPMKLALRYATDRDSSAWFRRDGWRFTKNTLYALERRGLIEYDRYMGRFRLTDAGRSAAAELKGDGNGAD